jgi:hypothetical protein
MKGAAFAFFLAASRLFAQSGCDPKIHNTLPPDAQNRSATQCEIEFDTRVRKTISGAFSEVEKLDGWIVGSVTPLKEISQVGKESEKRYYDYGYTDLGRYELKLVMDPASEAYKKWAEEYAQVISLPMTDSINVKKFMDFMYRMKNATHITISVNINVSYRAAIIKGGHKTLDLPNTAFSWQANYVGAMSGGGMDNAIDCTTLYLGNFSAPVITKDNLGMEGIEVHPQFGKGTPLLSVQNMYIRMEANSELVQLILSKLDLVMLNSLLKQ